MPTRLQIIIASLVLLFLVGLAWFFYKRGKKQVTLQYLPGELPGNPSSGNVIGASNDEIKSIAIALYQDMNGFNAFGHNYEPYQRAVQLSNNDLLKLYNTFNTMYQGQSGETLTQWISNERYTSVDLPSAIISRLSKLNAL